MKQVGFNHNIRHLGVLFHVQTEDYGLQLHRIVTQVFHSGQLISKTQTCYQELIATHTSESLGEEIKEMMKTQHKKVLMELKDGQIDIPENILSKRQSTS